jgi:hypothetical protein
MSDAYFFYSNQTFKVTHRPQSGITVKFRITVKLDHCNHNKRVPKENTFRTLLLFVPFYPYSTVMIALGATFLNLGIDSPMSLPT